MRITVSGAVQGVGYRYFITTWARRLGIAGRVKNLFDGRVEMVAQGERGMVQEFITKARVGPVMARVTDVQVEDIEEEELLDGFSIQYF